MTLRCPRLPRNCRTHGLHPYREIRRIHLELYLRQLEKRAQLRLGTPMV
ncbi:MAG: hypothetical protein M3O70_15550 [Actinomycetota bacterium]|nr:hypothetical protein [Actinomycetota bacterium]